MTKFTLEQLNAIIDERAKASDGSSYTASLIEKGVKKCAEKLGEEAIEAVIAAVTNDRAELINCLLYTSPSPRDQRGSRMPSSA